MQTKNNLPETGEDELTLGMAMAIAFGLSAFVLLYDRSANVLFWIPITFCFGCAMAMSLKRLAALS